MGTSCKLLKGLGLNRMMVMKLTLACCLLLSFTLSSATTPTKTYLIETKADSVEYDGDYGFWSSFGVDGLLGQICKDVKCGKIDLRRRSGLDARRRSNAKKRSGLDYADYLEVNCCEFQGRK